MEWTVNAKEGDLRQKMNKAKTEKKRGKCGESAGDVGVLPANQFPVLCIRHTELLEMMLQRLQADEKVTRNNSCANNRRSR